MNLTDLHGRTFTPSGRPGQRFYIQTRHKVSGRLLSLSLTYTGAARARAQATPIPLREGSVVRLVLDAAYPSPLPATLPPGKIAPLPSYDDDSEAEAELARRIDAGELAADAAYDVHGWAGA